MRKQLMLIAAPLCVVALAATVAGAVPSSGDASRGPKLDKLHAVRPIAAKHSVLVHSGVKSGEVGKAGRVHRSSARSRQRAASARDRRLVASYYAIIAAVVWQHGLDVAQFQAAVQAGQATEAAEAAAAAAVNAAGALAAAATYRPATAPTQVYSNSSPGGFLACVRNRESGGDYTVYNSGGSGAAGAYQFLPGTWDSIAASSGRHDLVGVSPANASPADQDAMAQALYAQQGSAPWGGSCG
jgi:hypothetical protein